MMYCVHASTAAESDLCVHLCTVVEEAALTAGGGGGRTNWGGGGGPGGITSSGEAALWGTHSSQVCLLPHCAPTVHINNYIIPCCI